jgi:hypothetical protein
MKFIILKNYNQTYSRIEYNLLFQKKDTRWVRWDTFREYKAARDYAHDAKNDDYLTNNINMSIGQPLKDILKSRKYSLTI